MIPLEDFVAAASANWRRRWRFVIRFYIWFFLSFAVSFALSTWLPTAMIGLWAGVLWLHWRNETPLCPHCGKNNWANSAWTIATRNCGGCGRRMLTEPSLLELDYDSRLGFEEFSAWWYWASRPRVERILARLFPEKLRSIGPGFAEAVNRGGRCPRCAGALHTVTHSCLVVAVTGNCGRCGEQILREIPELVAAKVRHQDSLLALEDFQAASRSHVKTRFTLLAVLMSAIFAGIGLGALLLYLLVGQARIPNLQWWHLPVFFGPMIFFGLAATIVATKIERRESRLRCPHCYSDLAARDLGAGVIASRRCTNCGQRVLAEPNEAMPKAAAPR